MSFTTAPVQDGSVRLEHASNSSASVILKPEDGGGLMLWDPGTSAWRMVQVPSAGVIVDCANCSIDGVAGQTIRRMINPKPTQLDFEWSNLLPPTNHLTWRYNTSNGYHGKVKARGAKWNGPGQGSGKLYFEVKLDAFGGRYLFAGITGTLEWSELQGSSGWRTFNGVRVNAGLGANCWIQQGGFNGTIVDLGPPANGDVICFAVDFETGPITQVWARRNNGPWNGNAAYGPGGAGGISLFTAGSVVPYMVFNAAATGAVSQMTANLGATPFTYPVPSGFGAQWTEHGDFYNLWSGPVYDVFAKSDASGNISLDLSLGKAYTVDAATGFRVKTVDPTQRLVGRVGVILNGWMSTATLGVDAINCQMVTSWFKPRKKEIYQVLSGGLFPNANVDNWMMSNLYKDALHFVTFEEEGRLPRLESAGTLTDTVGSGGAAVFCTFIRNQSGFNPIFEGGGASVVANVPFEYYTTIPDTWSRMDPLAPMSFSYSLAVSAYGPLGTGSFNGSFIRADVWT